MKEMWDSRYASEDYAYGTSPNEFFKNAIHKYKLSGNMLLPADGEGRNGVYAAKHGIEVTSFDTSIEGKNKALKLAAKEHVTLNYLVGDLFDLHIEDEAYDSVALIFAHLPSSLLTTYHRKLARTIKPNGMILLEGFSKEHLIYQQKNPKVGGPKDLAMLFSKASIQKDFYDFQIIQLEEVEVELNEGIYHQGIGHVVRFVGKKIK